MTGRRAPEGDSVFKARLRGLMKEKGFEFTQLSEKFGQSRAHSWFYGKKIPRADDVGFRLAAWLEVPPEYLYGQPVPRLDALKSLREVAATTSLSVFLEQGASKIPTSDHPLYFTMLTWAGAPTTAAAWRTLTDAVVRPARQFEIARGASMEGLAAHPDRRSTGVDRRKNRG